MTQSSNERYEVKPTSSDVERMRELLEAINRRLSPAAGRTFDGLIQDAGIACDYARTALDLLSLSKRETCGAGAAALPAQHTTPGGWVLVPREPTEEMIRAGGGALKAYIDGLSPEERAKLKPRKTGKSDNAGYNIRPQIKASVRWQAMIDAAAERSAARSEQEK